VSISDIDVAEPIPNSKRGKGRPHLIMNILVSIDHDWRDFMRFDMFLIGV
jgi:hypothetical protein